MSKIKVLAILIPAGLLGLWLVSQLPPIQARMVYWKEDWHDLFNPPEEAVFLPGGQQDGVALAVSATLRALTPAASLTPTPAASNTAGPTATPTFTPTTTLTPTPLPGAARVQGVDYQHQHGLWNYCGPANLAMLVSFWGWETDRLVTGAFLRGSSERFDDKNTMPYEMASYVQTQTELRFLIRVGGNLDLLRTLIANGLPVLVEKDDIIQNVGWLGHYLLLVGYEDDRREFISMDTYHGEGTRYGYDSLEPSWRAFNFTFLVAYPLEQEENVLAILGPYADENWAVRHALEIATAETATLSGRDLYFAWFNLGSSYVQLLEYGEAAFAYDQAFQVYANLAETDRPFRMLWYQTGPYWAYYYTGRYQDVIDLATLTLDTMSDPILEESWYWRGLAKEALGDLEGALADLQESVRLNPNFSPGWDQIARIQAGG